MRIAVVSSSWPSGPDDPSGHFVASEARRLERAGHVVIPVIPRPGGAFGWPGVAARVKEDPFRLLDAARWVTAGSLRVRAEGAQCIVAHWAVPCAVPMTLAAPHDVPLEVVSHGGDVRLLLGMPAPLRARLVATVARRATVWRFVSHALLDQLFAGLSRDARREVLSVAIVRAPELEVPDVTEAVRARRRELGEARVAVSVGRLVPSKRVDRAIEHVARAPDLDALVVVGDGPQRPSLEGHARRHGVDARFVGAVPRREALAWIGAADCLIHASEAEGLSTVLREAEQLGTRVVQL